MPVHKLVNWLIHGPDSSKRLFSVRPSSYFASLSCYPVTVLSLWVYFLVITNLSSVFQLIQNPDPYTIYSKNV